jgi:hypothetical protein
MYATYTAKFQWEPDMDRARATFPFARTLPTYTRSIIAVDEHGRRLRDDPNATVEPHPRHLFLIQTPTFVSAGGAVLDAAVMRPPTTLRYPLCLKGFNYFNGQVLKSPLPLLPGIVDADSIGCENCYQSLRLGLNFDIDFCSPFNFKPWWNVCIFGYCTGGCLDFPNPGFCCPNLPRFLRLSFSMSGRLEVRATLKLDSRGGSMGADTLDFKGVPTGRILSSVLPFSQTVLSSNDLFDSPPALPLLILPVKINPEFAVEIKVAMEGVFRGVSYTRGSAMGAMTIGFNWNPGQKPAFELINSFDHDFNDQPSNYDGVEEAVAKFTLDLILRLNFNILLDTPQKNFSPQLGRITCPLDLQLTAGFRLVPSPIRAFVFDSTLALSFEMKSEGERTSLTQKGAVQVAAVVALDLQCYTKCLSVHYACTSTSSRERYGVLVYLQKSRGKQ